MIKSLLRRWLGLRCLLHSCPGIVQIDYVVMEAYWQCKDCGCHD